MKLLIIFLIALNVAKSQTDSTQSPKKYSTAGFYISPGFYYKSCYNFQRFNQSSFNRVPYYFNVYSSLKGNLKFEFLNNISVDIGGSYSSNINNDYSEPEGTLWSSTGDKMYIIESNLNLPCYRKKRHGGLFLNIGTSYLNYKGYYSEYEIPNKNKITAEHLPMNYKLFEAKLGIGAEYKFKYIQLYSVVNFGRATGKFNDEKLAAKTREYVVGARFKIPKVYKKLKRRYSWF